ncbi:hypothetical protein [Rhodoferax sp.]|uniref:hypothetical protein n=1 Tax=Rhodoferax sp. TaxID=50421 RepID=UPI0027482452|nr:hypothetical protein [Rhodoferax sp.]
MEKTKGMAQRKRAIEACLKAGFDKAFIDSHGDLIACRFDGQEESQLDLIVRDWDQEGLFYAWVVRQPLGSCSPAKITELSGNGCSPRSYFKTIEQAACLAIRNPHY